MFEKGDIMETIRNVDVNRLHDFKNHPFKVEMNTELCELMRSIEKEGVLVPLLVRTNPYGDGYEVISGHRRKEAAIWAGETKVPVVIRELDDDQAVVAMVDSNLHRENLKPSEKAFAYKMKLDAMKHQGKHLDSGALAQVGPKFTDGSQLNEKGNNTSTINSNELLARQVGESVAQIKRYIRLTKLIPKILDMVDDGKIAFTIAVELSYLSENEQYELHAVMDLEQCTPSLSQANRMTDGKDPSQLIMEIEKSDVQEAKNRLLKYRDVFKMLQETKANGSRPVVVSDAEDVLTEHSRGYGNAEKPEDYLNAFSRYIQSNRNEIAALNIICTRPKDLTRKDLKDLRLTLDREGFTTQQLNTALYELTNEEIMADIISLIRRYAIGSTLISHAGSSFGSCGTSLPRMARSRILYLLKDTIF